jgi:hypothetical protein
MGRKCGDNLYNRIENEVKMPDNSGEKMGYRLSGFSCFLWTGSFSSWI